METHAANLQSSLMAKEEEVHRLACKGDPAFNGDVSGRALRGLVALLAAIIVLRPTTPLHLRACLVCRRTRRGRS
jgi:hypothetical protein